MSDNTDLISKEAQTDREELPLRKGGKPPGTLAASNCSLALQMNPHFQLHTHKSIQLWWDRDVLSPLTDKSEPPAYTKCSQSVMQTKCQTTSN